MTKNIIVVLFAIFLVAGTGFLLYEKSRTHTPLGIINPTPTVGSLALQDIKQIMNTPSSTTEPSANPVRTLEGGLQVQDMVVGGGQEVVPGMAVAVHYTGWLADGTKFDSSLDRGEPFSFLLGQGQVIKGWDLGVAGMRVGGKRHLIIPSDLGYGDRGAGDVIPPGATLVFDVELLAVQDVKK